LQEEAPEKYQSHFARWLEAGVDPEDIEELYKGVSVALSGSHLSPMAALVCAGPERGWHSVHWLACARMPTHTSGVW
jgi:hypothetical protein